MNEKPLLNYRRLPARLSFAEAGQILNCTEEEVAIGVKMGIIRVLGHPQKNCRKWISSNFLLESCQQERWLSRLTDLVYGHWRRRNFAYSQEPKQRRPLAIIGGSNQS